MKIHNVNDLLAQKATFVKELPKAKPLLVSVWTNGCYTLKTYVFKIDVYQVIKYNFGTQKRRRVQLLKRATVNKRGEFLT